MEVYISVGDSNDIRLIVGSLDITYVLIDAIECLWSIYKYLDIFIEKYRFDSFFYNGGYTHIHRIETTETKEEFPKMIEQRNKRAI